MRASTIIIGVIGLGVVYLLWKNKLLFGALGASPSAQSVTRSQTSGSSPLAAQGGGQFNFQQTLNDVTSLFNTASNDIKGSSAQTAPATA